MFKIMLAHMLLCSVKSFNICQMITKQVQMSCLKLMLQTYYISTCGIVDTNKSILKMDSNDVKVSMTNSSTKKQAQTYTNSSTNKMGTN